VEPVYTEQRDAILAASYANEPLDTKLLADAFAKRGLGTCAIPPPVTTSDCTGLLETFTTQGNLAALSLTIDDKVKSCDDDGILDADEIGNGTVTVMNTGLIKLTNTKVTLSSSTSGVTFPNGPSATIADLDPFATATVPIQVALDKS